MAQGHSSRGGGSCQPLTHLPLGDSCAALATVRRKQEPLTTGGGRLSGFRAPGRKERREAWAAKVGDPSAQGRRGSCPGRGWGCRRRLAYRAFVLAAKGEPGRSLRRRGTGWDLPVGELGAPGGHPSRQGAMLGRWPASSGEGSAWDGAPPSRPSPAPGASAPRNFRKHLRMVGSRRVKAQSKARERRGRAGGRGRAVLGRLGLCVLLSAPQRPASPGPAAAPRAGTFPLPGSAPGQGPAPALRLRPCPPSTVLVQRRPSALPTPAPPAAVASSTLRTPSRSPRPPQPAPVPVHLVWLQAPPLTGSAFAAAFAERRERSFSRSWSDPTPMKADTSHDSRDSRCPAAQASAPLPEAPLGPSSALPPRGSS